MNEPNKEPSAEAVARVNHDGNGVWASILFGSAVKKDDLLYPESVLQAANEENAAQKHDIDRLYQIVSDLTNELQAAEERARKAEDMLFSVRNYVSEEQAKAREAFAREQGRREAFDAIAQAHRLAMELECLLLDCNDTAAVSKWWDSAHEALEQWRQFNTANLRAESTAPIEKEKTE